jgi:glycosyltransferase involved in cell wall biosynthesis
MHISSGDRNSQSRDVVVIHETNGRKYLEALTYLQKGGKLRSLHFVGASVIWSFFHSLLRERKGLRAVLRLSLDNLVFRLSFWKLRHHTVILCVAPWDYRFLLYGFLRRRNRLIYNTSWPHWHGSRVPRKLWLLTPLLRLAWRRILSEPTVEVVAVVSAAAQSLASAVDLERPPTVISHTVSDVFFRFRARHALPLRLLFVGELSTKKGVLELPKLLEAVHEQGVLIDIVGDGPLREVAREIAQRANCHWHGQVTDRAQLAAIAANCQILVSPALSTNRWEELFGMSILEAMASGLPSIVSDHVGPRSIIRSGVDGVLVPEGSTDIIASWIKKLHADPEQWEAISQRAVATAQKYSLQEIAARWERLLLAPQGDASQALVAEQPTDPVLVSA